MFGKTDITDELRKEMHSKIGHGITVTAQNHEPRMRLFCDGMSFNQDLADPVSKRLSIHMPSDYIYWVLVFRKDMVSEEEEATLHHLSAEDSAQRAIDMTASWSEQLRAVMKHQQVDAASTLAFLTASPDFVYSWSSKPSNTRPCATLICDAAHPAPPVGKSRTSSALEHAASP